VQNYVELKAAIVAEKAELNKLPAEEMGTVLRDFYATGKQVLFVEKLTQFFSDRNFLDNLNSGDLNILGLIAEHRGIQIGVADVKLVSDFRELQDRLKATLDSLKPSYKFATVPANWTVADNLVISSRHVYRKRRGEYKITLRAAQTLWEFASKVWSGESDDRRKSDMSVAGYYRDAVVSDDSIAVGCQTVKRYEIEQLALAQGWAFPK